MTDPAFWTNWLHAEWTAIAAAPFSFLGALIVGWLIGWLGIRAWYRRLIQIEKGQTKLIQAELDIERRQKEGLRQAVLELKPGAPVVANRGGAWRSGNPESRQGFGSGPNYLNDGKSNDAYSSANSCGGNKESCRDTLHLR